MASIFVNVLSYGINKKKMMKTLDVRENPLTSREVQKSNKVFYIYPKNLGNFRGW